jgi:hypothetical protein
MNKDFQKSENNEKQGSSLIFVLLMVVLVLGLVVVGIKFLEAF